MSNVRVLRPAEPAPVRVVHHCPSCAARRAGVARRRARVLHWQEWAAGTVESLPGLVVVCALVLALLVAAVWLLAPGAGQ